MDQFQKDLLRIATELNRGATLDQVMISFYNGFKKHVPYDRIGVSVISDDRKMVRSIWARSEYEDLFLGVGYQSPLSNSTLQTIIDTRKPRIINDLEEYLTKHPNSHSTQLIVKEGIKSSLTCPIIADNRAIGFLFFSKNEKRAYENIHVEKFMAIAEHLSLIVARTLDLERLRQLNEMKNKFLGIVAHDLRSPLALIQSYIDIINNSEVCADEEQRSYFFNKVKATTKRMLNLINDLLDISAIESGNLQLELIQTDLVPFLQSIAENHELTAKAKNISIVCEIPNKLPFALIDTRRLTQVVDNLITNAVKFSPSNTTVKIKAEKIEEEIKISVIDQGPGIPKAELPKLFTEFSKTSVRPTDGEKSTGLGLAIVKKIVTGHGGKVGVNSKVGQGSTFFLTLPIATNATEKHKTVNI